MISFIIVYSEVLWGKHKTAGTGAAGSRLVIAPGSGIFFRGCDMEKKKYDKPKLKSQKIQLGVFGSYSSDPSGSGNETRPPSNSNGWLTGVQRHME